MSRGGEKTDCNIAIRIDEIASGRGTECNE